MEQKKGFQEFNPLKIEKDGDSEIVQWTTVSVNIAKEAISNGRPLRKTPFYENNPRVRKGNIVFRYTQEELLEIIKCKNNIYYFIENYVKVRTPKGKVENIKLRDYQIKQIHDYCEYDENILGWSRQTGKTIGTSIFITHAMMFNTEKQTGILANKKDTSKEVLDKIKDIYCNLPFFLQAGVVGWNESTLVFDNDCKIFTGPAKKDALNGRTCNILYIDEFAFIGEGENKIEFQKELLANALPVLSSQKKSGLCKLIITSTPDGKDYYYDLLTNAINNKNSMNPSMVYWWQIPDKDEKWALEEISKIGLAKFRVQFEMSFDVTLETLLKTNTLRNLSKRCFNFSNEAYDFLSHNSEYAKYLFFREDVHLDLENDFFLFSVDIAEGLGGDKDASTIQIFKLVFESGMFKYKQVGFFQCNEISVPEFSDVTAELFVQFNPDNSRLLVEENKYGEMFFYRMESNGLYEVEIDSICMFKHSNEASKKKKGLRTNANIKQVGVKAYKTFLDSDIVSIYSEETRKEVENYQEDKKGSYNASIGHDDLVTPLVNMSFLIQQNDIQFMYWLEDYCEIHNLDIDIESNEMKKANLIGAINELRDDDGNEKSMFTPEVLRELKKRNLLISQQ